MQHSLCWIAYVELSVKSVTQTKQKIKVNLREHQDDTLELVITTGDTISNRLPDYEAPFATYELIVSPGDEIEIVPKSAVLYIQVLHLYFRQQQLISI